MKLKIDFNEPIIKAETALKIQTDDLDDFYSEASDFDKTNLFFVLLASLHYYSEIKNNVTAAHLSFLAAYYLFSAITPPASDSLALHYIKKAISLNPLSHYKEWLKIMEKGN